MKEGSAEKNEPLKKYLRALNNTSHPLQNQEKKGRIAGWLVRIAPSSGAAKKAKKARPESLARSVLKSGLEAVMLAARAKAKAEEGSRALLLLLPSSLSCPSKLGQGERKAEAGLACSQSIGIAAAPTVAHTEARRQAPHRRNKPSQKTYSYSSSSPSLSLCMSGVCVRVCVCALALLFGMDRIGGGGSRQRGPKKSQNRSFVVEKKMRVCEGACCDDCCLARGEEERTLRLSNRNRSTEMRNSPFIVSVKRTKTQQEFHTDRIRKCTWGAAISREFKGILFF